MGDRCAPMDAVYCDGLERVEVIGGTVRFMLFRAIRGPDGDLIRQEILNVILPIEATNEGVVMTIRALAQATASGTASVIANFLN